VQPGPNEFKTVHHYSTGRATVKKPKPQNVRKAKDKVPDPERKLWNQCEDCPCMAYAVADYVWMRLGIDVPRWRAAVKRRGLGAYGLWIKEAAACAKRGRYLPDAPSISGGFSADKAVPGFRYQPPADCLLTDKQGNWNNLNCFPSNNPPDAIWTPGIAAPRLGPYHELGIRDIICRWFFDPNNPANYEDYRWSAAEFYLVAPLPGPPARWHFNFIYEFVQGFDATYEFYPLRPNPKEVLQDILQYPFGPWKCEGLWK